MQSIEQAIKAKKEAIREMEEIQDKNFISRLDQKRFEELSAIIKSIDFWIAYLQRKTQCAK